MTAPWMLGMGVALLVLVAYDAISTTINIGAAAGPLTSRVGSRWLRLSGRLARRPDSFLVASAGTVVVLLTIGLWLGLLWTGWTLVFSSDAEAVVSSTTGEPASGWSRVYFAGFTAFTLGVGDYVPNGQPWEVVTAVAVVSGLGLTTMAITYLVPVVNAVTARRVQANTIAGMGGSPQELVIRGVRARSFTYLEHRLQSLGDALLATAERHLSYPVLHYFHSAERNVDLRVQVLLLDEAITILRHGVAADARPHPAVLDGVRHAIVQLVERATGEPPDTGPPGIPRLDALRDASIPTVDDATFARRVGDLADHRRRVAHFADESLWSLRSDDTHNDQRG